MTTQDHQGAVEAADGQALAAAAGGLTYPVAPGYRVRVRKGPGTDYPVVRQLAEGATIQIRCQQYGEKVSGPYGTSDIWDNIAPGQYISDTYVRTGSSGMVAQRCTS
ncbi:MULTISPECIES: peptidase [unclassified Streptomyces]|uniref:peptidase n=1 Tax=Streptomyces TaxID=1883 RepID=UPI0008239F34|nr:MULTISPECIES: peptidase [unclassified Streptomyces]AWN28791.1 peptidase [Streptomyces sp. NEAU-S7GS2]MYT16787.1 peptidase [Streptomyces sp. SID4951]SCK35177.1 Bacterial SH3 domain [Streptomyces sp. SceaMP-e96]